MIKKVDEWITYAKMSNKCIVFYQDKVLNLSGFINQHPGGKKAITNYQNKDITNILFTVFHHKKETTLNTLMKFSIGRILLQDIKTNLKSERSKTPTPIKDNNKIFLESKVLAKDSKQGTKNVVVVKVNKSSKEIKQDQLSKQKKKKEHGQRQESKDRLSKKKQQEKGFKDQSSKNKGSCHSINSDIDEQKPIFKVPILHTKNIFSK